MFFGKAFPRNNRVYQFVSVLENDVFYENSFGGSKKLFWRILNF